MTSRRFCFTIYDLDCVPTLKGHVRYVQWQLEECPTTKRKHYQGWCQLKGEPRRGSYIQKLWGCKFHYEAIKGSDDENAIYCSKGETKLDGPWELGARVSQGQRTDIEDMVADVKEEKNDLYILENHTNVFLKYSRGYEKAKAIYQRQNKRFRKVQVHVLWGEAGSGKTSRAVESVEDEDYYLLGNDADTVWWDGYDGEKTLIIDDFYGWIKYANFLRVLDGYQMRLPIKGSFTYARWETVYITSNQAPEEWYGMGMTPALERRISTCEFIKKCHNVTE